MENKKLHIGLVLPEAPGYSETFFTNKIRGLEAAGHTVTLYVNSITKPKTSFHIKTAPHLSGNKIKVALTGVWGLLKTGLIHFKAAQRLYGLDRKDGMGISASIKSIIVNSHLLSDQPDWVHFGFGTMALGRENVAAAIGAKMAVSFRGFDMYVYPVKHTGCYKKLFSKRVKYHVLSEEMKKDLRQQGINEASIIKITPAIDISLFSDVNPASISGMLKILTIARLHWIKGLEQTLEALAMFKEKNIPFQYTIIGEGSELERLQFAAYQLGLTDEVVFKGKLTPPEVKVELQKAEFYIQYSHQEGFSNSVLEAQGMGKLCIVSDADGLVENVLHGKTGFVVPKRNPHALAEMIAQVAAMPDEAKTAMAETAVKRVAREFTVEGQIEAFERFYRDEV